MALTNRTYDAAILAATDILRILRDGGPHSRGELAERLGLARSTISLRVDPLIAAGLLSACSDGGFTGGRRAARLSLNTRSRTVLAADVGLTHAKVAITNLSGEILASEDIGADLADGPEVLLNRVMDLGSELLARIDKSVDEVVAVGLGLPMPIDHDAGRPASPVKIPAWDGFDIHGWFHQRIGCAVVVDNDVNIMTVGERAGAWPDVQNFMFIKVSAGVGAGIITSGVLQRGDRNIAGQIGHIAVTRGAGTLCRCGNEGCVTAIASSPAIASSLENSGLTASGSSDIVDLVKKGDPVAVEAVRQAGRALGEICVAAVALINPAVIAIGGSLAQVGEHLIAGIREVVYTCAMPLATENLLIVPSQTGSDAGVAGASIMAIEGLLSPEGISRLIENAA